MSEQDALQEVERSLIDLLLVLLWKETTVSGEHDVREITKVTERLARLLGARLRAVALSTSFSNLASQANRNQPAGLGQDPEKYRMLGADDKEITLTKVWKAGTETRAVEGVIDDSGERFIAFDSGQDYYTCLIFPKATADA
jgi:hypothetical protein